MRVMGLALVLDPVVLVPFRCEGRLKAAAARPQRVVVVSVGLAGVGRRVRSRAGAGTVAGWGRPGLQVGLAGGPG